MQIKTCEIWSTVKYIQSRENIGKVAFRALDNIFSVFFLAKFHLSDKNWLLIYNYKKKNSEIPSESEKPSIFVKHA